uniref:Uncharacterized protein n=1 Tax=Cannabis sativa TaxID=3483 RepID=A0A803NLR3_CANSA
MESGEVQEGGLAEKISNGVRERIEEGGEVFNYNDRVGKSTITAIELEDSNDWLALRAHRFQTSSGLAAIYYKMLRLKHMFRKFNKQFVGEVEVQSQMAKTWYQEAKEVTHSNPRDFLCIMLEKKAVVEFCLQEKNSSKLSHLEK